MNYSATLRKVATGEVRTFVLKTDSERGLLWYWTDGNYSCDCNRRLVWENYQWPDDLECSEGKYELLALEIGDRNLLTE